MRIFFLLCFCCLMACPKPKQPTPKTTTPSSKEAPPPKVESNPKNNEPLPPLSATLIVEIAEQGSNGDVGKSLRAALKEAGCTVFTKQEAETIWKESVTKKLEAGNIDETSRLLLTFVSETLIIGESVLDGRTLTTKLRRVDLNTGKELWSWEQTQVGDITPLTREIARAVLQEMLQNPPQKAAQNQQTKLYFQPTKKQLSYSEIKTFEKELLIAVKEISASTLSGVVDDTFILLATTEQNPGSLASRLDGQKINGLRLTVTKATSEGLFIVLK